MSDYIAKLEEAFNAVDQAVNDNDLDVETERRLNRVLGVLHGVIPYISLFFSIHLFMR